MNWLAQSAVLPTGSVLAQIGYPGSTIWIGELLTGSLGLLYFAFVIWMLIHCVRTEPDKQFWLWVMILVQGVGPIVYFVVRYLPAVDFRPPEFVRRWTRGRELERLETAAVQIGNAHQYTRWADALRDVGQMDEAAGAYQKALAKEPTDLPALWGSAQVAAAQKRFLDVRELTLQILQKDPQYKFGDVSLLLARALVELGEPHAAIEHLDKHIRRWRHPEALYLLAKLQVDEGDFASARLHLQGMLHDIAGSPSAIARKHGRWKSVAKQLQRKIGKS